MSDQYGREPFENKLAKISLRTPLLPAWLAVPLKTLPFQYLAYFPSAVLVGKIQGAAVWHGLLAAAAWAVAFVVLARVLFRLGLRRYSAFGG